MAKGTKQKAPAAPNQNAVMLMIATGAQVFPHKRKETVLDAETQQPVMDPKTGKAKERFVIDWKLPGSDAAVPLDQLRPFPLTDDPASVVEYLGYFNKMPIPDGGYYSYTNDDGLTNPQIVKTFSPQGVAKIIAQNIEAAHLIIAKGGDDAAEMQKLLPAVFAYSDMAAAQIAEQKAAAILAQFDGLNLPPERKAAMLAAAGVAVPAATVDRDDEGSSDDDSEVAAEAAAQVG
jgi:hypothetical protein